MEQKIDFTNCKILVRGYGGANGNKLCIMYNNEVYMLKFPSIARRNKEIKYMNSSVSEYVSCKIIKTLGIDVQDVLIGTYKIDDTEKIVVACKDFTIKYKLEEFAFIKNTVLSSSQNGYGTNLDDMLDSIEKQNFINVDIVLERFWDMFVIDAFLGNYDRHNGNWGYLVSYDMNEIKLAPIYDCGSCLYPQNSDNQMNNLLNDKGYLESYILSTPNSIYNHDNARINYYNYLMTTDNIECLKSLKKIHSRINLDKINEIVDNTPYISEIHKQFIKTIIKMRKELILDSVIESRNI